MKEKLEYSYWFMLDNHTFIKPKGKSIKKVAKEIVEIAKKHPYGMACPVTVFIDGKESGRIGKAVHVDKDGNININEWIDALKGEHTIQMVKSYDINFTIEK